MNNHNRFIAVLAIAVVMFTACQRVNNNPSKADPNAQQHNEDVNNTKGESDNLNTDINNVLRQVKAFSGKTDETTAFNICGATVDTTQGGQYPTVVITFDGVTACGSPARKRSGTVKIELVAGAHWGDLNSKLRVTHTNYKVTFLELNNHYVTFNGIKYLTCLQQIDWITYYFSGAASTRIRERSYDVTVTFENGSTDSWNCARLTDWTVTGYSTFAVTVNGDTTIDGRTIDSWGTTRFGTAFTTEMITPWKSGTTCGWWRPTQGKYTSRTDNFTVTATAGVDQNGNVVSSGCGAYGYKLEWDYASGTASGDAVIKYF